MAKPRGKTVGKKEALLAVSVLLEGLLWQPHSLTLLSCLWLLLVARVVRKHMLSVGLTDVLNQLRNLSLRKAGEWMSGGIVLAVQQA